MIDKDFEFFNKYCTATLERMRNCTGYYSHMNRNEQLILDDILYERYCERSFEAFSDYVEEKWEIWKEDAQYLIGGGDLL